MDFFATESYPVFPYVLDSSFLELFIVVTCLNLRESFICFTFKVGLTCSSLEFQDDARLLRVLWEYI